MIACGDCWQKRKAALKDCEAPLHPLRRLAAFGDHARAVRFGTADWERLIPQYGRAGRCPAPAAPVDIAAFVEDIAELGIERVWAAVKSISNAHEQFGLADPTKARCVLWAVGKISKTGAPRSWPKGEHELFLQLPYDVQRVILRRGAERDREVRRAQNERDKAEAQLGKLQEIRNEKSVEIPARSDAGVHQGAADAAG